MQASYTDTISLFGFPITKPYRTLQSDSDFSHSRYPLSPAINVFCLHKSPSFAACFVEVQTLKRQSTNTIKASSLKGFYDLRVKYEACCVRHDHHFIGRLLVAFLNWYYLKTLTQVVINAGLWPVLMCVTDRHLSGTELSYLPTGVWKVANFQYLVVAMSLIFTCFPWSGESTPEKA